MFTNIITFLNNFGNYGQDQNCMAVLNILNIYFSAVSLMDNTILHIY